MESNEIIRYYNGRILKNHELVQEDFWVKNDRIIDPQETADREVDVKNLIIAPGYIDLQINGGFGVDFSKNPSQVLHVAKNLTRYGVTSFLPTLISLEKADYEEFIPILKEKSFFNKGAHILGLHLEGPFFARIKKGAHNENAIVSYITQDLIEDTYKDLSFIKMITLAPELPGSLSNIEYLKDKNIVVSAGHTNANYDEMLSAINVGVKSATHLFNAMPPLNHREPGCIAAILTNKCFYSVIADGIHVNPSMIKLSWKSSPEGLFLITDAMEALGEPDGVYHLGQMDVEVKKGSAYLLGTNTLAGSVLSMDVAVQNFHKFTGCTIVEALESASLKPANLLNLHSKGNLNVGSDADFIFLDDELNVKDCFILGEKQ